MTFCVVHDCGCKKAWDLCSDHYFDSSDWFKAGWHSRDEEFEKVRKDGVKSFLVKDDSTLSVDGMNQGFNLSEPQKEIKYLSGIAVALDEFKYKCYELSGNVDLNQKLFQDFLLNNAPCNYDLMDYKKRFEKARKGEEVKLNDELSPEALAKDIGNASAKLGDVSGSLNLSEPQKEHRLYIPHMHDYIACWKCSEDLEVQLYEKDAEIKRLDDAFNGLYRMKEAFEKENKELNAEIERLKKELEVGKLPFRDWLQEFSIEDEFGLQKYNLTWVRLREIANQINEGKVQKLKDFFLHLRKSNTLYQKSEDEVLNDIEDKLNEVFGK